MSLGKKIVVLLTACAVLLSFSACSKQPDNTVVAQKGDLAVPAGVYIANLMASYSEAQSIWREEHPDAEMRNIVKEKIEGENAPAWIEAKAKEKFLTYLMIEELFSKYQLLLPEAAIEESNQWTSYIWMSAAETYSMNGVSEDSIKAITLNSIKQNFIFDHEYRVGSELINEQEVRDFYTKNFARVVYLMLPKTAETAEGYTIEGEQEKLALLQSAKTQVEAGDNMEEIAYAFHLAQGNIEVTEELTEGFFDSVLDMGELSDSEYASFAAAILAAADDTATVMEDDNNYYFFYKRPLEVAYDEETYPALRADIIYDLKWEEFEQGLLGRAATELGDWTISNDTYTRYTAKKLKYILM